MNEERKGTPTTIDLPDGRGGWVKQEALQFEGQKQDPEKAAAAMEKAQKEDFFRRVGTCTEALNRYLKVYAKDHGLKPSEMIAAVYLENCNNRHFYPEEEGGPKGFDAITSEVWGYFKENVS